MIISDKQQFYNFKLRDKIGKLNKDIMKDNDRLYRELPYVNESGYYIVIGSYWFPSKVNRRKYVYLIDAEFKDLDNIKRIYVDNDLLNYGTLIKIDLDNSIPNSQNQDIDYQIQVLRTPENILVGMKNVIEIIQRNENITNNNTISFFSNLVNKMWNDANEYISDEYSKIDLDLCIKELKKRNKDVKNMNLYEFIDKWETKVASDSKILSNGNKQTKNKFVDLLNSR